MTEKPPRFLTGLNFLLKLPPFIRLPSALQTKKGEVRITAKYTLLLLKSQHPRKSILQ